MGPQVHTYSIASDHLAVAAKRTPQSVPLHNYGVQPGAPQVPPRYAVLTAEHRPETVNRDIGSRFGHRLRELRQERSLTQSQMAKKFGIDRSFISDVERGRKSISLGLLEVIAIGLKVSLSELFKDL